MGNGTMESNSSEGGTSGVEGYLDGLDTHILSEITPQKSVRMAVYGDNWSTKERRKMLVLALHYICNNSYEVGINWDVNRTEIQNLWKQDIGEFDPIFYFSVATNSAAFKDYK